MPMVLFSRSTTCAQRWFLRITCACDSYEILNKLVMPIHVCIYIYMCMHVNTALHCIALHYITLHYITLHYTTLHYITLLYVTLRSVALHYITLHCIPFHYITLHYITLHYITHLRTYIPIRTCMHTYISYLHYIHACMHACIHTYIHTLITYIHIFMHLHVKLLILSRLIWQVNVV